VGLKPEQIPPDCRSVKGDFPVDLQTAILWKRTDLYKEDVLIVAKNAQSFDCHGEKGTVYLFQFGSEAERKSAGMFVMPLLWGEQHPTEEHPELVLESGDVLTVISFRKAPKSLLAALQTVAIPSTASQSTRPGGDFPIPGHGSLRLKVPDRESKPGEYTYLTQGMLLTGELLTTFTVLPRTPESSDVTLALSALAAATSTK
jgi:hypothetical protein